jgi:hypothetical protein
MNNITLNSKSHRQYLIWKLQRDWPALRYGRNLNRLSITQLEAKVRQYEHMVSRQRSSYVNFLNSFQAA